MRLGVKSSEETINLNKHKIFVEFLISEFQAIQLKRAKIAFWE